MKLFRVSPTKQMKEKLLKNEIMFISGNSHLEGTFDYENDQFLCKHGKRYFAAFQGAIRIFHLNQDDGTVEEFDGSTGEFNEIRRTF
jgi:hypothetical protein